MRLICIIWTAVAFAVSAGCSPSPEKAADRGVITFVQGQVQIKTGAGLRNVKKDDFIRAGEALMTGPKSAAVVLLGGDAGAVEVQENAEMAIDHYASDKKRLVAKKGQVWFKVNRRRAGEDFQVVTPTAIAGVRGTSLFAFEDRETGVTGICHCQGAVAVESKHSTYKGNHDSDYAILTDGKVTIVLTPEDFRKAGIVNIDHRHSTVPNSPLGPMGGLSDEQIRNIRKLAIEKFKAAAAK